MFLRVERHKPILQQYLFLFDRTVLWRRWQVRCIGRLCGKSMAGGMVMWRTPLSSSKMRHHMVDTVLGLDSPLAA